MSTINITKVGVLSIGKLFGTVNLIIGLAMGIIGAIAGSIAFFGTDSYEFIDGLVGLVAIILSAVVLYPLAVFALGWLYGVLAAFIFNVVVGVSGGITLTVTETTSSSKK